MINLFFRCSFFAMILLLTHACYAKPDAQNLEETPGAQTVAEKQPETITDPKFEPFKARNGVEFTYTVILPEGFQKGKTYPGLLAFSAMEFDQTKAEEMVRDLFTGFHNREWIIVVPTAPKNRKHGWMNHPAHHALNDLMDHVMEGYYIEDRKFHLLGFQKGAIPAQAFLTMSSSYFQSLTTASSHYWDEYDNASFARIAKMKVPVVLICGENDADGIKHAELAKKGLEKHHGNPHFILKERNDQALAGLNNGALFQLIVPLIK